MQMELSIHPHDRYTLVAPQGRIDTNTAPILEKELTARLAEKKNCIVDFTGVTYISSLGLRTIMVAAKFAASHHCQLVLCHMTGVVKGVFEISGFHTILNIVPDLAAAAAKLDGANP